MISACSGASTTPPGGGILATRASSRSGNAQAGLRADMQGIGRLDADDLFDLVDDALRLCRGQIDLVQYRQDFQALFDRGVAVGDALRLDSLGGIDHQKRPLAGRQRARNFVGEIDVPRRVDEIQLVGLAIACRIVAASPTEP